MATPSWQSMSQGVYIRLFVCVCPTLMFSGSLQQQQQQQSPSPCRERACWVTAVWSSPGLDPDLLSHRPALLLPSLPLSHPLPLLPAGYFTEERYGFMHVCVDMLGYSQQPIQYIQLVYLSCSLRVVSF